MRRTTLNAVFVIAAAVLAVNCSKGGGGGGGNTGGPSGECLPANTPTIPQPQKNWRVNAVDVVASDPCYTTQLTGLKTGGDPSFQPTIDPCTPSTMTPNFAFQVDATPSNGNVLLTYGGLQNQTDANGTLLISVVFESGPSSTGPWTAVTTQTPQYEMNTFEFTPQQGSWWRVTLNPNAALGAKKLTMTDLGLYDVSGTNPKDYWLMTGASLGVQSFLNFKFKAAVKAAYPGYDPILANEAISGAESANLVTALPDILKRHPYAKYVGVDVGGNDITNERPFPRGNDALKNNLQQVMQLIVNAGKIPIMSRTTYRHYPATDPHGDTTVGVPPESNGSLPYVTATVDPIIKQWCPRFYDCANNRGFIDGYNFTLNNPNYLQPLCDSCDANHNCTPAGCDPLGTHFSQPEGANAWAQYWVDVAGAVVYGEAPVH